MECEVIAEKENPAETNETSSQNDKSELPKASEKLEELLGSLTTFNSDGSESKTQQLRTSARVYKKMKLEPAPLPSLEKPEKNEDVKSESKKTYRMLWTTHDKDLFFEALNEYGKDFEGIHSFLISKFKKKGIPDHDLKTKDQVRHLYYRLWHKILKYVQFSDGVSKVAQELYGLINYGEMRRKVRCVSQKCCSKLQELIDRGAIAIRDKGKTIRIRTPMCRALRRLNQLDERYDELKLPSRIVLELKPKNMYAYLKVQSMAQNPRLRTVVPLNKRLSSVIVSVSQRWKTIEADIYDNAILSRNPTTNDCVPTEAESNNNKLILSPLLRFTPPSDVEIEIPSINLSEYFTRQTICLKAYESKLGIKSSESQTPILNESTLKALNKSVQKKTDVESDPLVLKDDEKPLTVVEEVVSSIKNLQNTLEGVVQETESKSNDNSPSKREIEDELQKQATARINEVRKGWTLSNCASISIGDLYLMFGKHSKLVIEYSWDAPPGSSMKDSDTAEDVENSNIMETDSTIAGSQNSSNDFMNVDSDWECNITSSLRKLISIAKLCYRKNNNKCLCGHVCGKNNANVKSKSVSKVKMQAYEQTDLNDSFSEDVATEESANDTDQSSCLSDTQIASVSQSFGFRRPSMPTVPMVHLYSQLDSLPKLRNRYTNRKSKNRLKQVVVQRNLSLLPNNTENHQIVQLNIIPQGNKVNEQITPTEEIQPLFSDQQCDPTLDVTPTFKAFKLDGMEHIHNITDVVREGNSCDSFSVSEITGIASTPSTSPSRILKESDNQWLTNEVADFSLSSLLGHLESPSKHLLSIPVDDSVMNEEAMSN